MNSIQEKYQLIASALIEKGQELNRDPLLILADSHCLALRTLFNQILQQLAPFKSPPAQSSFTEIQGLLKDLSLQLTGARSGKIIRGLRTQAKDAVLRLTGQLVPPCREVLDQVRAYPSLWAQFLDRLGSLDFFAPYSELERDWWLFIHESSEEFHFQDLPNLKVEVLFPAGDLLTLPEPVIERISQPGVELPATELASLFPGKPGSSGLKGRHTLLFRRSLWAVSTLYRMDNNFPGPIIDLDSGTYYPTNPGGLDSIILLDGFLTYGNVLTAKKMGPTQTLGVALSQQPRVTPEIWSKLTQFDSESNPQGYGPEDLKRIRERISCLTPAGLKSFLQKIIRFRAPVVTFPARSSEDTVLEYSAVYVLQLVFLELLFSPGSFVPAIQKYISGKESALKRLVVSLTEDSWVEPERANDLVSLLIGALLAQRLPGWSVPVTLVEKGLELCRASLTPYWFNYSTSLNQRVPGLTEIRNAYDLLALTLSTIGSFPTDVALLRSIADQAGAIRQPVLEARPDQMDLVHSFDHHWVPELAYFVEPSWLEAYRQSGRYPLSQLFSLIFTYLTGVNPRGTVRPWTPDFESQVFVKGIRRAQYLTYLARLKPDCRGPCFEREFVRVEGTYTLNYNLDSAWVAALLGATEISGRPPALVTLDPDNLSTIIAIKKPSRNMKDPFLSEQREAQVIQVFQQKLRQGIPLKSVEPPVAELKGASLVFDDQRDVYYLTWVLSGRRISIAWEEFKRGQVEIPYIEQVELSLEDIIRAQGTGVVWNWQERIQERMKAWPRKDLQRALFYLGSKGRIIEFVRVGREGGSKEMISIEDLQAWKFLSELSLLVPSALQIVPGSPLRFQVELSPLLWEVKDLVQDYVRSLSSEVEGQWPQLYDRRQRTMWEHQESVLTDIKSSHQQGKRGNLLWLPVGSGKTLALMKYLQWLQSQKQLPPYLIYSLPASAIQSIIYEVTSFGFDIELLIPLKTLPANYRNLSYVRQSSQPRPFVLTLVEHDYLRRAEEDLASIMSDSILIIDESHKLLANSLRSAVGLNLASLSRQFLLMTGTIVTNNNTYELVKWLRQISNFQVNERNFWTASNAVISRRFDTGIEVRKEVIEYPLSQQEKEEYRKLTPPRMNGINQYPRQSDWRRALEISYQGADRGIIEQTLRFYETGVFVVARDKSHLAKLQGQLISAGVSPDSIFVIQRDSSIYLTDQTVNSGQTRDYKVVLTTANHSTGYSLTRLNTMIYSPFPSNLATRTQLRGRLNRLGRTNPVINEIIITSGLLSYILERHDQAKNISEILSSLAKEIQIPTGMQ